MIFCRQKSPATEHYQIHVNFRGQCNFSGNTTMAKIVTVILATEKYHKKAARKSTENNFTIAGQKNPSKIELIFGGQLPQK
jgi:hypothetical protein